MLSCFVVVLQTLEEEKERKSECLPPEPPADDPESVKIVFKLPNDTRVERRFLFGQSLTVRTSYQGFVYLVDRGRFILSSFFFDNEIRFCQRSNKFHSLVVKPCALNSNITGFSF